MHVMTSFGIIGLTVLEYFSVFYVFIGCTKLTVPTFRGYLALFFTFCLDCIVALLPTLEDIRYPLLLLAGYLSAMVLIKVVMRTDTKFTLTMFAVSFVVLTVVENLLEFVLKVANITDLRTETLLYLPIIILSVWLTHFISKRDTNQFVLSLPLKSGVRFTLALLPITLLFAYLVYRFQALNTPASLLVSALIVLSGIIIVVRSLLYIYHFIGMQRAKHECRTVGHYVEQQRRYFELLLNKEEETKKYRHDATAQLTQLQYFLTCGEMDKAKSYLDQLLGRLQTISRSDFNVGNEIVNALLNYYLPPLMKLGCRVCVTGSLPDRMRIPEVDLCTIVSNLLKNVSEAIQKIPNINARWIAIGLNVGTMFWSIGIRNSAAIQDSTMLAESNGIGHGYGLGNVRRAVEDHGGEFAYKLIDGVFYAEVDLPV